MQQPRGHHCRRRVTDSQSGIAGFHHADRWKKYKSKDKKKCKSLKPYSRYMLWANV
jgi:hypothetical protein